MTAAGILTIPCLGRPFHLGMLYDCRSESFIPGKKLWDSETLNSSMACKPQPFSNFEIIAEDTISKKSFSLGIDAKLKLSFMGGLLKVSGAAKYMDDRKSSEKQARVTLKYSSTTRFEELTMEQIGNIQYPDVLDDPDVTHIVSGVTYGSDAFFVFDSILSAEENSRNVQGNMIVAIKAIPGLGDISGEASLKLKDDTFKKTEKFSCTFYGDLNLNFTPSTFEEAVQVYRDLPNLLKSPDGDQSVPKKAILYPLAKLDSRAQRIVRSISRNLISKVEEIMEAIQKVQVKAYDLKQLDICTAFTDIDDQLTNFLDNINLFKTIFTGELCELLPKIRGTGAQEKELADLVSAVNKSPFNPKQMLTFTRGVERAVRVLTQHVKNMTGNPKIQQAFTSSDNDLMSLIANIEHKYVICFAFNVTKRDSPFLRQMEEYLTTKQISSSDEKEWFECQNMVQELTQQKQKYLEFVQTNSEKEDLNFAITDSCEDAESSGPTILLYTNSSSKPEEFEPPSQPRDVKSKDVTHNSVHLEWTVPEHGVNSVVLYRVFYSTTNEPNSHWTPLSTTSNDISLDIKQLLPNCMYYFKVQAVSNPGVSVESECYCVSTTVPPVVRPADKIKPKCTNIDPNARIPQSYQLPLTPVFLREEDGLYKYEIGSPPRRGAVKSEKVMIVLGATGAGKSTLINGIANYVLGVSWKDTFRFKIITDESKGKKPGEQSQAHSQTKDITAYTIYDTILDYALTIIDTPGFGDTGGIENDKKIVKQIRMFFSCQGRDGIDQLHGIGFVTQASLARLTQTQRYVFDSVLALFGKDIKGNIFLMTTFADANDPPVLVAVDAAGIPYNSSFKFNNSAIFAPNDSEFNRMFWEMGSQSFQNFFTHLSKTNPRSLKLTRQVLSEREQLENLIPNLQEDIQLGLAELKKVEDEEKVIKQFKDQIDANKDFTYPIEEVKIDHDELPPGIHTTTCLTCNRTCHKNCAYANNSEKKYCCAMSMGYCTVCPQHCTWERHVNHPYIITHRKVTRTGTYQNLKQNYDTAVTGKSRAETMLARNEMVFFDVQRRVFDLIAKCRVSVKRLDEIALKPNPLSEVEYIDLLIETEKAEHTHGWNNRVKQYIELRKRAVLLNQINLPIDDPKCIDHLEILIKKEEEKPEDKRDNDQLSVYRKFCSLLKRAKDWWNKSQTK